MIGILIVIALTVAGPIGILYLVVKATERERSAPSIGRRVSAFCFGAASLLGLIAIEVSISGLKNFHGILLLAGIPIMVTAALLAFILHRRIFTSSKTTAALGGGGIALATVLFFALLVALIAAPGKSEGMFMAAFGATMVLIPFGIPLFLFGAMVGLLLNRLTKNRSPEKKLV